MFNAYLKNLSVQNNHDEAGDIERAKGRIDDKVRVVKCTNKRFRRLYGRNRGVKRANIGVKCSVSL